jgi:branched-chain amino acid transport system substrate-binding protein
MKIGLLLPENSGYSKLAVNYQTGFEMQFRIQNQSVLLEEVETQFYSIYNDDFYKKAKSLLFVNDVDIVITHASISLLSGVWELFHHNQKFLLGTIIGEKVGVSIPHSPYVFINSLNLWQSNWMMGKWAAENCGKKVAVVTSFYDAGYDSTNTFKMGFENGGGNQVGIFMVDPPHGTFNPGAVITEIEKFLPDVIFACLSGIPATAFIKAYLKSSLKGKVELISSPLALPESVLQSIGNDCCGINSVFTWSPVLENRANIEFISNLQSEKIDTPDVFHLLGYETAMLFLSALNGNETKLFDAHQFSQAMEKLEINTPRGMVKMNAKSHIANSSYYLREVSLSNEKLVNRISSELVALVDENSEAIYHAYTGISSGWINPYLTT